MSGGEYRKKLLSTIAIGGVKPDFPILLHKTGSAIWKEPSSSNEDIADFLFSSPDNIYSFWQANSNAEILLAAHFLSSRAREPFSRSVHFVIISLLALTRLAPRQEQRDEHNGPVCRGIPGMHYNFVVEPDVSASLVDLMRESILAISKQALRQTDQELRDAKCRHYGSDGRCNCEEGVA